MALTTFKQEMSRAGAGDCAYAGSHSPLLSQDWGNPPCQVGPGLPGAGVTRLAAVGHGLDRIHRVSLDELTRRVSEVRGGRSEA